MGRLPLLVITSIVIAVSGCKHDPVGPVIVDDGGMLTLNECHPDSVYFTNQILPLFQSSCAISGCHDASTAEEDIILDSYENIMASGELEPFDLDEGDIYEVITESDPDDIMPPDPEDPLTTEQIQLIETWILQGAQNNGCEGCDFPIVSFSNSVFPLIQNKCEGCHSGDEPSADLLVTNYTQVSALVDDGSLVGVITWDPDFEAMPYNGNQLQQCEIDMIQEWIDNGALDD